MHRSELSHNSVPEAVPAKGYEINITGLVKHMALWRKVDTSLKSGAFRKKEGNGC